MLGVDRDPVERLKSITTNGTVLWRCFSDAEGSIAQSWHVRGYPTIYILDANGIIRLKNENSDASMIEPMIDSLLTLSAKNKID